jgi:protein-disulfide isomerase
MSKQARNKSRELRKAQAAIAAQRGRRLGLAFVTGGVIIVGLVIAIVVSLVNAAGEDGGGTAGGELVTPKTATSSGALTVGSATASVTLEVYLDYMCPFCGRFERANGDEVTRLVDDGTVKLELHPLSFLDRTSKGTEYSTRAANAVTTVADRAPDKVLAFNKALFARQPEEGSEGLSDSEIAGLARDAGVPDEVVADFADRTFVPWIERSTEAAFDGGITGTPTVKIDGKVFEGDLYTVGPLTQALIAAKDQ